MMHLQQTRDRCRHIDYYEEVPPIRERVVGYYLYTGTGLHMCMVPKAT